MEFTETKLKGCYIIQPRVFADARGYFFESYSAETFKKAGLTMNFVQDNQSLSSTGVLRGLHFQNPPWAQGKLVRVINGSVYDVVVDIRKDSPTYGEHFGIELNEENKTMLYIPEGFAHGFATLRDNTVFSYKCTNVYNKASEGCILWNDTSLNIKWNVSDPILSAKDLEGIVFKDFKSEF